MDILEGVNESPETARLKKIYFEACEEYECYHNDQLIDIIEGHSLTGTFLNLAGNLKLFLNDKLEDDDLHTMFIELQTDTFVTSINLSYNHLSPDVCISLGKALVKNKTILELDLTVCDIDVDGCYAISRGLEFNSKLKKLVLYGNKFGPEGCNALATVLQINKTLESLDIASTDQTSQSLISICTVLNKNTTITYLDVSRTVPYTDEQTLANHFSKLLARNTTLTTLKLSKCDISDTGANAIAYYLRNNTTLKHLDISSNKLSSDGAEALAELLKVNTCLEELCLCSNRIRDTGTIALSEVLACKNNTLKKLWITNNEVTGKGLSSLAASLQKNTTLIHLYVWGNSLDEMACNAFELLLSGSEPRLKPDNFDVKLYNVDKRNYLAETGHYAFSH